MPRDMHNRLPWQRNPKGGYIAYPEGEALPRRHATVHYDGVSSIKWAWLVRWEDAVESGHKPTKQEAANEATARWPSSRSSSRRLPSPWCW
jgi:hypothetical protein